MSSYSATTPTSVSTADLRSIFSSVDKNNTGSITRRELLVAMKHDSKISALLRLPDQIRQEGYSRAEFESVFQSLDSSQDGKVTLSEFLAYFDSARRSKHRANVDKWQLTNITIDGKDYLIDKYTNKVYTRPLAGDWPEFVGNYNGGKLDSHAKSQDFFVALDAYLKDHQEKLRDLFDKADKDKNGTLERNELARLVTEVMPAATKEQQRYFQVMVDIDGDGHVTWAEFVTFLKECKKGADRGHAKTKLDAEDVLARLATHVEKNRSTLEEEFDKFDRDGDNKLSELELSKLLEAIMPGVTSAEKRALVSDLRRLDANHDGKVSLREIYQALRVAKIDIHTGMTPSKGDSTMVSSFSASDDFGDSLSSFAASSSAPRAGRRAGGAAASSDALTFRDEGAARKRDEWVLEEYSLDGKRYLLDRKTSMLYHDNGSAARPVAAGRLSGGRLQPLTDGTDLFESLDNFLREKQARLKEVFDHFDKDKNGKLDASELRAFIKELMPQCLEPEQRYFKVMLDLDGDGKVTYEELLGALKECKAGGARLRSKDKLGVDDILFKIAAYVDTNHTTLESEFRKADTSGDGSLDADEMARLVRRVVPAAKIMTSSDQRVLISELMQLGGYNRKLTLQDLKRALQMYDLKISKAAGGGTSQSPSTFTFDQSPTSSLSVSTARSPAKSAAGGFGSPRQKWELETLNVGGKRYLLDPETRVVYTDAPEGEWPQRLGTYSGGRIKEEEARVDFFVSLDDHLQTHRTRLRELFDKYDLARAGSLRSSDLGRLLRDIMPQVTDRQTDYFMVMLDLDGDGKVTYEELLTVIKDTRAAGVQVRSKSKVDADDVLGKLMTYVRANHTTVEAAFRDADRNGDGRLDYRELLAMLGKLMPALTDREKRALVMDLERLDHTGRGQVSLLELKRALRDVAITRRGEHPATPVAAAAPSTPTTYHTREQIRRGEWHLNEYEHGGKKYLRDPRSKKLFTEAPGGHYRAEGHVVDGKLRTSKRGESDFFDALDTYLKANQMKLREVFDQFSSSSSGVPKLSFRDLQSLCRKLMPDVEPGEVEYFECMIDLDGDGQTTYDELLEAFKECRSLAGTSRDRAEKERALDRIAGFVSANEPKFTSAFSSFDSNRDGLVSCRELVKLVKHMMPRAGDREVRQLLAGIVSLSAGGDFQFSQDELRYTLGLVNVHRGPAAPRSPLASRSLQANFEHMDDFWDLEEISIDRSPYLVDRRTQDVYHPCAPGDWPELAGRLEGGRLVKSGARNRDFFGALDEYLKLHRERLRDVFNRFDTDHSGDLDKRELEKLVREVMSDTTAEEAAYFGAMISAGRSGRIRFDDLIAAIRDCREAGVALRKKARLDADDVLYKLSAAVYNGRSTIEATFRQFDTDRNGKLDSTELVRLIEDVLPGASSTEQRHLLQELQRLGSAGGFTLPDLKRALHLMEVRVVKAKEAAAGPARARSPSPAPARGGGARGRLWREAWELEEISVGRDKYLHDPATDLVYHDCRPSQWPQVAGRLEGGSFVEGARIDDFFSELDAYLKDHRAKLRDMFDDADLSRTGKLGPSEVDSLVRTVMPRADSYDLEYFGTMLDIDGDGSVTFDELIECIRESRAAGAAARGGSRSAADAALRRAKERLETRRADAEEAFRRADRRGDGNITMPELRKVLRELLPDLTRGETRALVAEFGASLGRPPKITIKVFSRVLRMVEQKRRRGRTGVRRARSRSATREPAREGARGAAAPVTWKGGKDRVEWRLEEFKFNGRDYLVDPETDKVYEMGRKEPWPTFVGRLVNGRVEAAEEGDSIFDALDLYLRRNQTRLGDFFDELDTNRTGYLESSELKYLIRKVLPEARTSELRYLEVMLDLTGDGKVSYNELVEGIKECRDIGAHVRSKTRFDVDDVMAKLVGYASSQKTDVARAFEEYDTDGNGRLNQRELMGMLAHLMPALDGREKKYLLADLRALDMDGDGQVSLNDIYQALRLRDPHVVKRPGSAVASGYYGEEWPGNRGMVPEAAGPRGGYDPYQAHVQKAYENYADLDDVRLRSLELRHRMDEFCGASAHIQRLRSPQMTRRQLIMAGAQSGAVIPTGFSRERQLKYVRPSELLFGGAGSGGDRSRSGRSRRSKPIYDDDSTDFTDDYGSDRRGRARQRSRSHSRGRRDKYDDAGAHGVLPAPDPARFAPLPGESAIETSDFDSDPPPPPGPPPPRSRSRSREQERENDGGYLRDGGYDRGYDEGYGRSDEYGPEYPRGEYRREVVAAGDLRHPVPPYPSQAPGYDNDMYGHYSGRPVPPGSGGWYPPHAPPAYSSHARPREYFEPGGDLARSSGPEERLLGIIAQKGPELYDALGDVKTDEYGRISRESLEDIRDVLRLNSHPGQHQHQHGGGRRPRHTPEHMHMGGIHRSGISVPYPRTQMVDGYKGSYNSGADLLLNLLDNVVAEDPGRFTQMGGDMRHPVTGDRRSARIA